MAPDGLRRARRARRRLSAAGWLTVAAGLLIAASAALLAPFFFPFGLAVGALSMLAGRQLVRLRGAIGALLAAGASLVAAGASALAAVNDGQARWLAGLLAVALALLGTAVLLIVYIDAGHLPSARRIEND